MATIRADLILPTEIPFDVSGFWDDDHVSVPAFGTGIDKRDGQECIIDGCGYDIAEWLDHCHIVGLNDRKTWNMLQQRKFIPQTDKWNPLTYPRNGLLMCKSHHSLFDAHYFFLRYRMDDRKYYFINAADEPCLEQFHGRPAHLEANSSYAPHPNLLLYHEIVCRGRWLKNHEIYFLTRTTSPSTYTSSSSPSTQRDAAQSSRPGQFPLPVTVSPTTWPHSSPEIIDAFGAPEMNPLRHVTELKQVSVLFGHWETKAVKELVLAEMSSTEMEEYDLRAWDEESSESNGSGAADFNWALPRVVEKVDNWLSTVVDTPQVVNNSCWSTESG